MHIHSFIQTKCIWINTKKHGKHNKRLDFQRWMTAMAAAPCIWNRVCLPATVICKLKHFSFQQFFPHNRRREALCFFHSFVLLSVCPSVRPLTAVWRATISVLCEGISTKLGIIIHHSSFECTVLKDFQGQKSTVKVTARWNILLRYPSTYGPSVRCPLSGGIQIDGMASRLTWLR